MKTGPVTADDIQRLARFAVGLAKLKVQKADREDIVSELELAALKCWKRFPKMGRAQFATYFLSFAIKEAKKLAGNLSAAIPSSELSKLPAPPCSVVEDVDAAAVVDSLISKRDSSIIDAVFIDGMTHEAVAKQHGLTQQAVNAVISRAIKKAKKKVS
jgi:RNA polymerase sigma factor (sigma-70 family)